MQENDIARANSLRGRLPSGRNAIPFASGADDEELCTLAAAIITACSGHSAGGKRVSLRGYMHSDLHFQIDFY